MSDNNYTVFSDGGSRGNPGPAAFGYVIYNKEGELVSERAQYIGVTTNNQAEYQGVVAALESLVELNVSEPIVCKLDSQLVVRQINGIYRMKNADLKPWLAKVHELKSKINVPVRFMDVPREENKEADRLVNVALDGLDKDIS